MKRKATSNEQVSSLRKRGIESESIPVWWERAFEAEPVAVWWERGFESEETTAEPILESPQELKQESGLGDHHVVILERQGPSNPQAGAYDYIADLKSFQDDDWFVDVCNNWGTFGMRDWQVANCAQIVNGKTLERGSELRRIWNGQARKYETSSDLRVFMFPPMKPPGFCFGSVCHRDPQTQTFVTHEALKFNIELFWSTLRADVWLALRQSNDVVDIVIGYAIPAFLDLSWIKKLI